MEAAGHIDILEQRESLRKPLFGSVALHAAIFASIFAYTAIGESGRILWGDPHSLGGGGGTAITPVRQIPLPSRGGRINPVANDSESNIPAPPKPEPKRARAPEPDAIPLRGRAKEQKKESKWSARQRNYESASSYGSNQIYSGAGQALSSPMFGAQTGTGGVGVGPGSAFGERFGWYRDLLERKISERWQTSEVDARIRTAPPVIVTFEIQKSGQVSNVRVLQSSGNRNLDYSAQRAVYEANPFPALPAGYTRSSAQIEIWFQLKR